jgi:hypothetical protein
MKKFPKIRYPGDSATDGILDGPVVVMEKLDGANFRWRWDDDMLYIGTRNHWYHESDDNIPHAFSHAIDHIKHSSENPQRFEDYTFFGEAMHLHSLEYENVDYEVPDKGSAYPADLTPNVFVFDAWDNEADEWAHYNDVMQMTNQMGLTPAPPLEYGDPNELSLDVPDESVLGGPPEGIVVRRLDGTVRSKKVTDDFKEKNATTFNDAKKAATDAGEFVATYVTDARVEKHAHKLVDEGEYDELQMQMMERLPEAVLRDVFAEHGWEILNSSRDLPAETKDEIRSRASKKCARVLKEQLNTF